MFVATLVFLFLIRLRFPKNRSVAEILHSRYGVPTLRCYRDTERIFFKIKKIEKDLSFLNTCKSYGQIPKFIKFKVHKPSFIRLKASNHLFFIY